MSDQTRHPHQFYHTPARSETLRTNLSGPEFSWLLAEAWDEKLISYYLKEKNSSFSLMDKSPTLNRRKNKQALPPPLRTSWLLTDPERTPLGWAEVQTYESALTSLHLCLGGFAGLSEAPPWATEALAHLLSACFLSTKADLIKIASHQPAWATLLPQLQAGELRTIVSPFKLFGMSGILPLACSCSQLSLAREEWWEHELGKKCRQSLNYLALRQAKQEKSERPKLSVRRKGLAGFFGWGRKK